MKSADQFRARFYGLAVRFVSSGRVPDVDGWIRLACDLITSDLDTPATVEVACLPFGTPFRDAEAQIRAMLHEQQIPVPAADATDSERFDFMLKAFGSGGLSVGEMTAALFNMVPSWQEQTETQRALMRLTIELDHETTPGGQARVIDAMRAVADGRSECS